MLLDFLEEVMDAHKSATVKETPKSCVDKYIQGHSLGKDQDLSQSLSIRITSWGQEKIKGKRLLCTSATASLASSLAVSELAAAGGGVREPAGPQRGTVSDLIYLIKANLSHMPTVRKDPAFRHLDCRDI